MPRGPQKSIKYDKGFELINNFYEPCMTALEMIDAIKYDLEQTIKYSKPLDLERLKLRLSVVSTELHRVDDTIKQNNPDISGVNYLLTGNKPYDVLGVIDDLQSVWQQQVPGARGIVYLGLIDIAKNIDKNLIIRKANTVLISWIVSSYDYKDSIKNTSNLMDYAMTLVKKYGAKLTEQNPVKPVELESGISALDITEFRVCG